MRFANRMNHGHRAASNCLSSIHQVTGPAMKMKPVNAFFASVFVLASAAAGPAVAADTSAAASGSKSKQSQSQSQSSAQKKSSQQSHDAHEKTTMDKARPATSGSGSAGGETGGPAAGIPAPRPTSRTARASDAPGWPEEALTGPDQPWSGFRCNASCDAHSSTAALASSMTLPMVMKP